MSRAVGRLADVPKAAFLRRRVIEAYIRAFGVDMSEADVPEGGFTTFDAFFTRSLRPGARPICVDDGALASPADGRLEDFGPIDRGATFRIKGRLYDVGELLGDTEVAARYEGGWFAIIYLSPRDYHRVHAPVSGRVVATRHVDGTLFPVNAIGLDNIERLFARNERLVVHQLSETFGDVATVLVGAVGVGRISLAFDETMWTNAGRSHGARTWNDGPHLNRGDELGVFHLGSTVIFLVGREAAIVSDRQTGESVRVGEALGARGRA